MARLLSLVSTSFILFSLFILFFFFLSLLYLRSPWNEQETVPPSFCTHFPSTFTSSLYDRLSCFICSLPRARCSVYYPDTSGFAQHYNTLRVDVTGSTFNLESSSCTKFPGGNQRCCLKGDHTLEQNSLTLNWLSEVLVN